jgi:sialidase-1
MKRDVFPYLLLFMSLLCCQAYALGIDSPLLSGPDTVPGVRIDRHFIIYEDARFHSAFPSVVKRKNGELIVAFRRAPDRKIFGEKGTNHVDPNSYLVKVTSKDGVTWSKEPELIYAHAFGGSQDPCLLQLRNGTILCTSYGWAFVRPDGIPNLKQPNFLIDSAVVFLGGYVLTSYDGAKTWEGPLYPPHIAPEVNFSATGEPLPAYNRGALYEGNNGKIFWVVAASEVSPNKITSNHLLVSEDKGKSWKYSAPVAVDKNISFNEASVYETPKGDLVAFLRTGNFDDLACIARSQDGGKTFQPWQSMGFQGHPLQALRLPDDRVLLTYGYRHKPYGIRARILNPECTDFATAPEIVLRTDAGTTDIGYPWAVMLDNRRVLVTYYYSVAGGPQHIAGTIMELDIR